MRDTDGLYRSRLTAEDFQTISYTVDPAWTKSINPLFILVAETTYP